MQTWEILCRPWMTALNDRKPKEPMPLLTDDFKWVTSVTSEDSAGMDAADLRGWCLNANVTDGSYTNTIYGSEDILAYQ